MRDLIYLLVFCGFFAVVVGVLHLCERIIGPDDVVTATSDVAPAAERTDAS